MESDVSFPRSGITGAGLFFRYWSKTGLDTFPWPDSFAALLFLPKDPPKNKRRGTTIEEDDFDSTCRQEHAKGRLVKPKR